MPVVSSPLDPALVARAATVIESSIRRSEEAVMTAGSCLGSVVEESQAQVQDLAPILPQLNDSGEGSIGRAIEEQTALVRSFSEALVGQSARQAELATRASEIGVGIDKLTRAVEQIAFKTRILSVNASIECARLGKEGKAMSVIAGEMQKLSVEVRAANDQISRLTHDLAAVLPDVIEVAQGQQKTAMAFSVKFAERQFETERSFSGLVGTVSVVLEQSQRRADRVLQKSQEALSALQFQDPVAQDLRRTSSELTGGAAPDIVRPEGAHAAEEPEVTSGDTLLF